MRLTERRKMEVNENRGRLCRKKLQGKIRKKKNHQKEKDITGSVKRANHYKGSMIVFRSDRTCPAGRQQSFFPDCPLCVATCFIHGAGGHTLHSLSASGKRDSEKKNHLKTRKSTSWHRRKRKGHCFICLNIV